MSRNSVSKGKCFVLKYLETKNYRTDFKMKILRHKMQFKNLRRRGRLCGRVVGAGSVAEWLRLRAPLRRPRVQILGADMALLVRPR